MKFRDKKLFYGIINVGILVIISLFIIFSNFTNFYINLFGPSYLSLILFLFLYILITLPLDIITAKKVNLSNEYSMKKILLNNFLIYLILTLFATILFFSYKSLNFINLLLIILSGQIFILLTQKIYITTFYSCKNTSVNNINVTKILNSPSYITMGIITNLYNDRIFVPDYWFSENEKNYNFEISRYKYSIDHGINKKVIFSALIINTLFATVIFSLLIKVFSDPHQTIIIGCCIFNLLSFIYILLLPNISQKGVLNVDIHMENIDKKTFEENIKIYEKNQDKNDTINKKIELIFYPIPSLQTRIKEKRKSIIGLPNISRILIFLNMINFSLIFKCVHGNAGKPENWFYPPSQ